MPSNIQKQSYFFPEEVAEDIRSEAKRLERPLSWVMQRAWKFARAQVAAIPGPGDVGGDKEA